MQKYENGDRKRILLVTGGYPYGESERGFLQTEVNCLRQRYDLVFLAENTTDELKYPMDPADSVQRFSYPSLSLDFPNILRILRTLCCPGFYRDCAAIWGKGTRKEFLKRAKELLIYSLMGDSVAGQLRAIVEKEQIDLVYTYWCKPITLAALRLKKKFPSLKVITRFHGVDLYNERALKTSIQPFRHTIGKESDLLVFACEKGRQYFCRHWGYEEKSVLAYLGCRAMEQIPPRQERDIVLVSCSNLFHMKRVQYIADALAIFPKDRNIFWHHFGDGTDRTEIEKHVTEKLSGISNVGWKFWGAVSNKELDSFYRKIQPDVFITTSSTEGGTPVSVQEALAMGIPVIGTDVGGIPEAIIHGVNGYLLSDDPDPSQIVQAILAMCPDDAASGAALRAEAYRVWQEKFDAEKNAGRFIAILQTLI